MAQLFKKIIKTTSFLLILILSTGSVSAQKSKKKSTKSTATKTKTTTTSTTTSTKTTTKVEKKTLETKLSEEEQKKQDISTGKKLASAIKSDTQKSHSVSGIILKRYISSEEGKFGADILEITGDANIELTSINTILETYIAETFEYSPEDADTLASFIVSFNTKNRNNQDYLIKNFSTNVVLGAKKEKIGLPAVATVESINGQSQVLIPIERNILKKYALDVASLELLDQTKSDLVL